MTQLIAMMGNSQQLDGGAMFGNVPKMVWSQWIRPDENRILLACRALIQDENKNILWKLELALFFNPVCVIVMA